MHEVDHTGADPRLLRHALFIVHSYPPSTNVAVQRTSRFIKYLPSFGWRVDVVAPSCPAPESVVDLEGVGTVVRAAEWQPLKAAVRVRNRFRQLLAGHDAGAAAGRAPEEMVAEPAGEEGATARPSLASRVIDPWFSTPDAHVGWYPQATRVARAAARQCRSEVLYTSGPPHSSHLVGWKLRHSLRIPWVADFRDPWSRRPWLSERDRRGLRHAAQVRLEAAVIGRADRVVLNTEAMTREFQAWYPAQARKFCTITNGFDSGVDLSRFQSAIPPSDVLTLTHAGSLYRRRDPRPLLDALGQVMADEHIPPGRLRLHFLGHIDTAFGVPARVQALGLQDTVRLTGRVSREESLETMWRSHVLVLLQPGTHLQVPAKLFEYLQAQRTILALTPEGATAEIVREAGMGMVVPAEDPTAIAAALRQLWRRFSAGDSLRVDAGESLRRFDGRVLAGDLARLFGEVAGKQ